MSIFHYLYQPDKSALSPFSRALVAWMEIMLITVIGAAVAAGLDYLNGHPNDFSGALPFIESAIVIAFLKSFTTLGFSLKNLSSGTPPPPPTPTIVPVERPVAPPIEPTPILLSPQERPVFQPRATQMQEQEEEEEEKH